PFGMQAVHVSHEARLRDAVAEQLLHAGGQTTRQVRRYGERHVLDLAQPRLAVLRPDAETRAAAAARSAPMPEGPRPRERPGPGPAGMQIDTALGLSGAGASSPQRWLRGITCVAPFSAVKSSRAQIAETPCIGRGSGTRQPPSSKCHPCAVSPGWTWIARKAE